MKCKDCDKRIAVDWSRCLACLEIKNKKAAAERRLESEEVE